jgi:opacity protein-like surface antigen
MSTIQATIKIDVGTEVNVFDILFLRAGYQSLFNDAAINGLTLGGGLDYTFSNVIRVTVDYAWSDWGIMSNVNRFTLGISSAM